MDTCPFHLPEELSEGKDQKSMTISYSDLFTGGTGLSGLVIKVSRETAGEQVKEVLRERIHLIGDVLRPLEVLIQEQCSRFKAFPKAKYADAHGYAFATLNHMYTKVAQIHVNRTQQIGRETEARKLMGIVTCASSYAGLMKESVRPFSEVVANFMEVNNIESFVEIGEEHLTSMYEDIVNHLRFGINGATSDTNALGISSITVYYDEGIEAFNEHKRLLIKHRRESPNVIDKLEEYAKENYDSLPDTFYICFDEASIHENGKQGVCPITDIETFKAVLELYVRAGKHYEELQKEN